MADELPVEPASAQAHTRFSGVAAFRDAIQDFLKNAATQGWKRLILSDPNFADWPLGDRSTVEILGQWAGPGRSLVVLAGDYDVIWRRHARFVRWRRHWSHIIDCRRTQGADAAATPSAIWGDAAVLHRIDVDLCAGLVSTDPQRRVRLRQDLDEWLAVAVPAFPASTLGL